MKSYFLKVSTISLIALATVLSSCGKAKEIVNAANDQVGSAAGFWTTKESSIGEIAWKISDSQFKKCTIAFDTKIIEEEGSVKIDGNTVKYTYKDTDKELLATYNSDDKTLKEEQGLGLKYDRADDGRVDEYNKKGCHL